MNDLILGIIPILDLCMVKIFGKKSRWFQIHAIINMIIMYLVIPDTYCLLISPKLPLKSKNTRLDLALNLCCGIHGYHCVIDKLSSIELWHHLIFVVLGIIPSIYYFNSQSMALLLFTGCGFPGAIEYTMLSLVKHNKINSLTQKSINSYINNYIRAPLSIYGATIIHLDNNNDDILSNIVLYYICFLVYLNGTFFSKMAIENHMWHKCSCEL